jgi:hypothetical protein
MNNVSALEINSVRQFMIGVSSQAACVPLAGRMGCELTPASLLSTIAVAQQVLPHGKAQRGERYGSDSLDVIASA